MCKGSTYPLFLRKQKMMWRRDAGGGGGYRLILNLKNLNENIENIHFEMHGLKAILKMVEKNCFKASLDIKDADHSIPVDESSQKYLKHIWKEQLYQFCVLPNGLSPCSRWFTKLLKPPLVELRKSKHDISEYIHDIYLSDDTKKVVSKIL